MPTSRQKVTSVLFKSRQEAVFGTRGYVEVRMPLSVFPARPLHASRILDAGGWREDGEMGQLETERDGRRLVAVGGVSCGGWEPGPGRLMLDESDECWFDGTLIERIVSEGGAIGYRPSGYLTEAEMIACVEHEVWHTRYVAGNLLYASSWRVAPEITRGVDCEDARAMERDGYSDEARLTRREPALDPIVRLHHLAADKAKSLDHRIEGDDIVVTYGFKIDIRPYRRAFGRAMTALLNELDRRGVDHRFGAVGSV